jgi:hypothetical protein
MLGCMSRYAAARVYVLPESLGDLTGPTSGSVTLPQHIDWGPHHEYDLADEADLVRVRRRRDGRAPASHMPGVPITFFVAPQWGSRPLELA